MKLLLKISVIGLSMALLGACSSTDSPNASSARVAHKDERTVGYFSTQGEYSREKFNNGYERKLLGTTRDHRWVMQDLYAINGQAQTEPFTVFDERGLYDWNTLQFTDGPVVFYYADGKKLSQITMKQGVSTGQRNVYYRSGEVFQTDTFNEQGEVVEEVYFEPNGQRLFAIAYDVLNARQPTVTVYDAQGKGQFPTAENYELVSAVAEKIQATLENLDATEKQLAGQEADTNLEATALVP